MSHRTLNHDFGTFIGFNHREDKPINRTLTDEDIVWWDHARLGEATFWPTGGHAGLAILCSERKWITGMELRTLDRLLTDLGDDSKETYQRIHFARSELGIPLAKMTVEEVRGLIPQVVNGAITLALPKADGPTDWEPLLNGPLRSVLEAALKEGEMIPDYED